MWEKCWFLLLLICEVGLPVQGLRELRVGVLAPDNKRRHKDQGYRLRANFFNLLNDTVQDGFHFYFKELSCDKHNRGLFDVVCDDVDVLIHTQRACPIPLDVCNNAVHIMDSQDRIRPKQNLVDRMEGEIFSSMPAAKKYCSNKFCVRIPTYFDMQACNTSIKYSQQTPRVGIVGGSSSYGTIASTFERNGIPFVKEKKFGASLLGACKFYRSISVAVAWSPYLKNKTREYKLADYYHTIKPAERFTNPFWFDIPVIGYAKFASYQAYGNELLCDNDKCVVDLVRKFINESSSMADVMSRVKERVLKDTHPNFSKHLMRSFIGDVFRWKHTSAELSSNASYIQMFYS